VTQLREELTWRRGACVSSPTRWCRRPS